MTDRKQLRRAMEEAVRLRATKLLQEVKGAQPVTVEQVFQNLIALLSAANGGALATGWPTVLSASPVDSDNSEMVVRLFVGMDANTPNPRPASVRFINRPGIDGDRVERDIRPLDGNGERSFAPHELASLDIGGAQIAVLEAIALMVP